MAALWRVLCGWMAVQAAVVWVAEMSRHGSRSPEKFFPWDKDGRWAIGEGELTSMGMRQHYLIGAEMRQRYIVNQSVLSADYNASAIWLQSSDVNRTLMSAQSQLMGLFPLGPIIDVDQANLDIPPIQIPSLQQQLDALGSQALAYQRQAVPIHTTPSQQDLMLRPVKACQAIVNYNNLLPSTVEYNTTAYSSALVTDTLLALLPGENLSSQYLNIFNSIICNQFMGYELPANFTEEFLEEGLAIFNQLFAQYYQEDSIARLYSAAFFQELESNLVALLNGNEVTSFRYYSSHEETIAGVLAGLQVFPGPQPPFASTLVFEVSQISSQFTIRVLYNDQAMLIPTCPSVSCPLSTFLTYLNIRGVADYVQQCEGQSNGTWSHLVNGEEGNLGVPGNGAEEVKWTGWMTVGVVGAVVLIAVGVCAVATARPTSKLEQSQKVINVL